MNFRSCKDLLFLSTLLIFSRLACAQTTVDISVPHAHWASPVVEIFKLQCPDVLYELELTLDPKKLILRVQDKGVVTTTDLSDTLLLTDWLNDRYVWKPVFLCGQGSLGFNLQGVDLNGGRNKLEIVSAYSFINKDGSLKRYASVQPEPRDHLFSYIK
ncbi:hypothetical protein ACO0K9_11095 [Undibacterium sp. Ji50W]|uniref:hypothetical protein n=1 Tax=Undibacterium sp. Ji50W TaxID=3413041 RepID=UPI003BF187EE